VVVVVTEKVFAIYLQLKE